MRNGRGMDQDSQRASVPEADPLPSPASQAQRRRAPPKASLPSTGSAHELRAGRIRPFTQDYCFWAPDVPPDLVVVLAPVLVPDLVLVEPRTEVSPRVVVPERTVVRVDTPSWTRTRWPRRMTTSASTPTPPWLPCVQRCSHRCQCRYDRQCTSAEVSIASVATRTPAGEVDVMALAPGVPRKPTATPATAAKMKEDARMLSSRGH